MIDSTFLSYIKEAEEDYKQYRKKLKSKMSFEEFLLILQIYKTEEILERLEDKK